MNKTSDVALATPFHMCVIRTPIPAPDFAGAPPFYYCGFIQQQTSNETGKRLAKFLNSLKPLPSPTRKDIKKLIKQ
ncbi:hypothetical protein [Enterobacter hormaechei]|uniref:hypothetical protein n=1 Tax=Enterobacter hormaechei TaxID=158836 RepID=UPI000A8B18A4|nr:hypothetical protein [Enterobacter hormaechei]HDT4233519.1 hypothetical protein [Enterobacter hormaechei subsp. steigerwaltii]